MLCVLSSLNNKTSSDTLYKLELLEEDVDSPLLAGTTLNYLDRLQETGREEQTASTDLKQGSQHLKVVEVADLKNVIHVVFFSLKTRFFLVISCCRFE